MSKKTEKTTETKTENKSETKSDNNKQSPRPASANAADQLLRLHVVSARFDNIKEHPETFVIVNIGKKSAKTLPHDLKGGDAKEGPKEVFWNEHFAIEYEKKDEESVINLEVCSKSVLGEFHLKLSEIEAPKAKESEKDRKKQQLEEKKQQDAAAAAKTKKTEEKSKDKEKDKDKKDNKNKKEVEAWGNSKPREAPLTDKKGNKVGVIILRIRREVKLVGTLNIDLKELDLEKTAVPEIKTAKCVYKLGGTVHETPAVDGKAGKTTTHFAWKNYHHEIDVNTSNHVYDVFIEVWNNEATSPPTQPAAQDKDKDKSKDKKGSTAASASSTVPSIKGTLLGQARLTLYDTRSKFNIPLTVYAPDQRSIGQLKLQAKLKQPPPSPSSSTSSSSSTTSSSPGSQTKEAKDQKEKDKKK